jgi:hypothetical protein
MRPVMMMHILGKIFHLFLPVPDLLIFLHGSELFKFSFLNKVTETFNSNLNCNLTNQVKTGTSSFDLMNEYGPTQKTLRIQNTVFWQQILLKKSSVIKYYKKV